MNLTTEQKRRLREVFRMPSVQTMVSRKSSITNAFVNSLIPVIIPTEAEIQTSLDILGMSAEDVRCAYCGDRSTEWDHLRPLVKDRRPTGYASEIGNLVPACGKCNQSKGNRPWREWMLGPARHSPATRGTPELEHRIDRLAHYESWRQCEPIDFREILGAEKWEAYWARLEEVVSAMSDAQVIADHLRDEVRRHLRDAASDVP